MAEQGMDRAGAKTVKREHLWKHKERWCMGGLILTSRCLRREVKVYRARKPSWIDGSFNDKPDRGLHSDKVAAKKRKLEDHKGKQDSRARVPQGR